MQSELDSRIFAIRRPAPALMKYYVLASFLFGPFLPFALLYSYFRYHTMRYQFDEEGISMSWGILFRREITLTYARIQDIHLTSNILERWLRLARIQIQTASASAAAEMTIEGLHEFETVRDFLYTKMRGVRDGAHGSGGHAAGAAGTHDEALALLEEIRGSLGRLESRLGGGERHG